MTSLDGLLFPRSIAIVGASPRRLESIETTVRSGVTAWGVNPGRDAVGDLRCYPSVAALPEVPDVAFVLVGHERVEAAVADALDAGVTKFVVPGVGAEAGEAGHTVAARLAALVRDAGGAMVGPNCMGVYVPGGPAAWIGSPQQATAPGHVSVLCQSGSIASNNPSLSESR